MSGHGPAKRRIPIAYEKRKKTSMKKIFEEEMLKYNQMKAAKKESEIRQEIQHTLSNIDAIKEAIKFRKFIMLTQNNNAFRKQVGLLTLKEMEKLKKDSKAYQKAKEEAKKANRKWESNDPAFMRKWETEVQAIERKFPEMKRKMNAKIHGGLADELIENLFRTFGWEKLTNIPFNLGILKEMPPLVAQYMEHRGIKNWQKKANDEIILTRMRERLAFYQEQQEKRKSSAEKF